MATTNTVTETIRTTARRSLILTLCATLIAGLLSVFLGASASAATTPTYLGTLSTKPEQAQTESNAGIKIAMVELSWAKYETAPGVFDKNYENIIKWRVNSLKAAGMKITLGLGLHYTPQWIKDLPNGKFIAQDGTVSSEANVVFNQTIRTYAEEYFARADTALRFEDFWSVRVNSGARSEVMFPSGGKYWAFDTNAQNGPAKPPTMATNPLPGWKPGTTGKTQAQVTSWLNWYVGALADVARWQATAVRNLGFTGYIEVLTPGIGVLNYQIPALTAANLPNGNLGIGVAWGILYSKMVGIPNVVAHVTSVADGSKSNAGCTTADRSVPLDSSATTQFSATAWISRIADEYGFGKSGENPGLPGTTDPRRAFYLDPSPTGMMAVAVGQARSCGFKSFYWAHDDNFWNGLLDFNTYAAYDTTGGAVPPNAPTS